MFIPINLLIGGGFLLACFIIALGFSIYESAYLEGYRDARDLLPPKFYPRD